MYFYFDNTSIGMVTEKLTSDLFRGLGYRVIFQDDQRELQNGRYRFDVCVSKNGKTYAIEVKASTSPEYNNLSAVQRSIDHLIEEAQKRNMIPVLMVYSFITQSEKDKYRAYYNDYDLRILDLSNILYMSLGTKIHETIISFLPFSVNSVDYEYVDRDTLELVIHDNEDISANSENGNTTVGQDGNQISYIDPRSCPYGQDGFVDFEEICSNALNAIFSEDLALWEKQKRSNEGLYRFDMLCRIKDNNTKTFWSIVERHFNSKYVVFEYKNYEDEIGQREVYTTERYLYDKALRNVAIVIARSGYDKNSYWATKGSLREQGKLIILLDINDLNRMIDLRNSREDPSSVLLDKLDSLLIELEK